MSRKQADQAEPSPEPPPPPLSHASHALAQVMQTSPSVIWFASANLEMLLDINPAGLKVFGQSKSDLVGASEIWLQTIHVEDRSLFEELSELLRRQGSVQLQYRVVQPTGDVRWLRDNIALLPPVPPSTTETEQSSAHGSDPLICGNAVDVTDIVQQQQQLQESNDVLSGLVQQLPMNVLRKDLRGRIVFANQQFCDTRNVRLSEVVGKTDFDLYPAELAKKYCDDDRRVLESGELIEVFEKHQTPTGKTAFVQVRKGPVWDANGEPVGLQIMFWDATDRKQAEMSLERERNLLHSLLDNGPDSIYFKDLESRFIRVSRGLSEKFHLESPGVAIGMTDADFFSEEHAHAAREDELEIMRGGESILDKEERETWGEGEDTWCSTSKMALRDPHGNVIGTFGISRDITDKKHAKAELGRERDLLKTIIDNVPDLIFAKDRVGRFVIANKALLSALHVDSMDEVVGKTDYDFSQPELACNYVADDQIVMRNGEALIDQEENSYGLDGREVCRLMSKVPLRDHTGEVRGLVGIGRDITRRKQESETLRNAMEAADNASQAKSDFLANMSHEIRTPLNAIIGMTDLVLETELADSQSEFLKMVKESGATLLRLINDILDFSKVEAGKLELDPVVFHLREQLGSTMKSMAFRANEKSLELAFRIDPDVPPCLVGDAGRLRQIVVNLLANAIKFTEEGEVVLDVRCNSVSNQVAQLQFSVRDTGIGISKEKRETIFAEFEQADSSTTRQYGGTGLGLAISTRLVELMEGRLWVESELGVGSTFHFSVSLEVADSALLPANDEVVVGGTSVLIVDDNATNRLILEEMVTNWGMLATQADSALAARVLLDESAQQDDCVQLILSDVNMPTEDGFDLANWIRDHVQLKDCPIIMLGSGDRQGDRQKRHAMGIAAHLTKPVGQSELFDVIVRVLGKGNYEGVDGPVITPNGMGLGSPLATQKPQRTLRILLAEDSVFNQKLAVALLEKKGHVVCVAGNGVKAVELVQTEDFELVLMDVQMPEMDGLEATRTLRRWEEETGRARIPIIAMTAHAFKGDREQCLAAGMDDYLSKPIDAQGLYAMIDSMFAAAGEEILLEFGSTPKTGEATADTGVVDFDVALQRVGGATDTLRTLSLILLEECPKMVAQIEQAIASRDAKSLQRAGHTLKGSSSHFAATGVAAVAKEIELFGKQSEFENASKKVEQVKAEVRQLEQAIRAKFAN